MRILTCYQRAYRDELRGKDVIRHAIGLYHVHSVAATSSCKLSMSTHKKNYDVSVPKFCLVTVRIAWRIYTGASEAIGPYRKLRQLSVEDVS